MHDLNRAKIPHDPIGHEAIHITYRLKDSIPRNVIAILKKRRRRALDTLEGRLVHLPEPMRTEEWNRRTFSIEAKYELSIDEALHKEDFGPYYLKGSRIAAIVLQSWMHLRDEGIIFPIAVCVMSNHVHVVLRAVGEEQIDIGKLMKSHKGYTARLANQLLGRTGESFWENIYFDRRVRRGKFMRVVWYVLNNPVKARLVGRWSDWGHTYLAPDMIEMFSGEIPE